MNVETERDDSHDACCFCGARASDRFREVICWEALRAQGGANAMIGRTTTGRVACSGCIAQLRQGIAPGTAKLFE